MKKLFALTFLSINIFFGNQLKADWTHWWILNPDEHTDYIQPDGTDSQGKWRIYTIDNQTGEKTLKTSHYFGGLNRPSEKNSFMTGSAFWDDADQLLIFENEDGIFEAYDPNTDTWSSLGSAWRAEASHRGTLINRYPPIRRSGDTISIGDNSLKLKETSKEQQLWGTNADGEIVPLNIVNGSKLLINGRDVEQSINNVGALSAALTGLPTVPSDTTLACGLGTGTHGGDFAFSGGCASKVNDQLSINYAASMTMPGQDYAGNFEDKFSARAGFVWQLGKSIKPNLISMKEKETMEVKIDSLEDKNKKLEDTVSTLIAKLERLEKIALSETQTKDLATIKLP